MMHARTIHGAVGVPRNAVHAGAPGTEAMEALRAAVAAVHAVAGMLLLKALEHVLLFGRKNLEEFRTGSCGLLKQIRTNLGNLSAALEAALRRVQRRAC